MMRVSDFVFPFWRATWHLWFVVPYHRIRGWWWKRQHPIEYEILETFVKAYEAEVAERGFFLLSAKVELDRYRRYQLYGELALTKAPLSKVWIIDGS